MSKRGSLIFLGILLALLSPFLVQIGRPFFTAFLLATILAIVLHPGNRRLVKWTQRPELATLATTAGTVVGLGLVIGFVGLALTRELTATYEALSQSSLEEGGWPALATHTADRLVDIVAGYIPLDKVSIRGHLLDGISQMTVYLRDNVGSAVGGLTSVLLTSLLTTIFLYYFLLRGEVWLRWLSMWTPLDQEVTESLILTVKNSVIANINGVFAVVLAQGVCLSLGFWFVGLRSPVLWGAVGGLASIIPFVGSPMIWLPIVAAYLFQGSYWLAVGLALWGAFIVGSVDDVLRPFVVGAREKQHPVLIALAAVGGTYAFGALGFLLGPLVLSLVVALLKEIQALVALERAPNGRQSAAPADSGYSDHG
jgi:predicted PurR-regulated permease PerM